MSQVGKCILDTWWSQFARLVVSDKWVSLGRRTYSLICLVLHTDWFMTRVVERTPSKSDELLYSLVMLLWFFNLIVFMFKPFCFSFSVAPPTRLRYNVISHDSIQISWKAPRGKFGGYKLLVTPASGKTIYYIIWSFRNFLHMDG